ncbi:MAG: class I SAM-dependent methyltransferase [bacterium]|nr:class I SAM-dependent methyltransferase [bacterium]
MSGAGLAVLSPREGEFLLEIGFGTGSGLAALARAAGPRGRVLGVDPSCGMMRRARRRVARTGHAGRVDFIIGDARRLPLAEGRLDGVFMSFTLELFPTDAIPRVLAECRRVLRPGGRLAVVAMSRAGNAGPYARWYRRLHNLLPGIFDCEPIMARRALEQAGFRIERSQAGKVWRLPVEIILGCKGESALDGQVPAGYAGTS